MKNLIYLIFDLNTTFNKTCVVLSTNYIIWIIWKYFFSCSTTVPTIYKTLH